MLPRKKRAAFFEGATRASGSKAQAKRGTIPRFVSAGSRDKGARTADGGQPPPCAARRELCGSLDRPRPSRTTLLH